MAFVNEMSGTMRIIKRIIIALISLLLVAHFVYYVAIPVYIFRGGFKPSERRAERIFRRDKDILIDVKDYIEENNYESIHIDKREGELHIYPEEISIDDEKIRNEIQTLIFDKHYNIISNNEGNVDFQIWATIDKAVGFVFNLDGNTPDHDFIVKTKDLGDGWYLYDVDFVKWKYMNKK